MSKDGGQLYTFDIIKKKIEERKITTTKELLKALDQLSGENVLEEFNKLDNFNLIKMVEGSDKAEISLDRFKGLMFSKLNALIIKTQKNSVIVTK